MEKIVSLSVELEDDLEPLKFEGLGSLQKHTTVQTDADGSNKREIRYVTATLLLSEEHIDTIVHTVSTPNDFSDDR